MSVRALPDPDDRGPEHVARNLYQVFRKRLNHAGKTPETALPAIREELEAEGFTVNELSHDAKESRVTVDYDPPKGMNPEYAMAVVAMAIKGARHSQEWAINGVVGPSWELGDSRALRPDLLYRPASVVRFALESREG